jgi:nitroimidazol reductase NimA-like FMN-containing flavoprotein (pyridoxamine 5'-phosphate oxidase superfamily)
MDEEVTPSQAYELDHRTCLSLLATQRIGRLVFDDEPPAVLVVHFGMAGERLVLTGGEEQLVNRADRTVVIEVDDVDEHQRTGWSVIVRGRLEVVAEMEPDHGQQRTSVAIVDLTGRWVRGARRIPPLDQRGYL